MTLTRKQRSERMSNSTPATEGVQVPRDAAAHAELDLIITRMRRELDALIVLREEFDQNGADR